MSLLRRRKKVRPSPDTILSPEGVPLTLRVAGVGVRMAAQITDIVITLLAAGCFLILLALLNLTSPQTLFGIGSMLFFITRIPYYVVTELAWNGQTLGKRMMKIKVVSHDGRSLQTHAIVLRNLMKEAEIFLPATLLLSLDQTSPVGSLIGLGWVAMALTIPVLNPHRQRLGDIMAGTHVIHLPQPVLLQDLARETPVLQDEGRKLVFLAHQLDHYGAFELQTLEGLLRVDARVLSGAALDGHRQTMAQIIDKVRRKIGFADPVAPQDHETFLRAFYTAQRAHLEQRQLFGDRRADKHHAQTETAADTAR
jgi:uncharacterized RDD family membrane protein YckC